MAKQKTRATQELESLIPTIKSEEKHLDDLLADARVEAERVVREAEQQAAARIHACREQLPERLAAERESRRVALVEAAGAAARAEEEKTRILLTAARAAMKDAVAYVVSLVWPRERP